MVYLITIIFLCVFIFVFDLGNGSKKNADTCYKLMLFWFIALSGFAYNVGSDTVAYMEEYEVAKWSYIHNLRDFLEFENSRQPGWLLLEFICRSISSNFVFFKLIIAGFCNWAVFRFIKKHSSFPFIAVLFYGLVFALHLNFNALRQFIAVGFFLIGYDFLIERKWLKYYFFVFLAYMFHSSALICIFFPLLFPLKLNKIRVVLLSIVFLIGSFILLSLDMTKLIGTFLLSNEELLTEALMAQGELYLGDKVDGVTWSIFGMIRIAFFVGVYLFILLIYLPKEKTRDLDCSMYLVFVLFYVLNFCIPIVFFRFLFYVQPFFVCLLPGAVIKFANKIYAPNTLKPIIVFFMLVLLSIEPISNLYSVSDRRDVPLIVQYNPYYSVFNPKIDPVRSKYFGSYRK